MPTRPKTNRKLGPPTKKNADVIKRLIAAARLGLPYAIVSARAGITRETLNQWRSKDAELDRQLDEARAEAAEEAWKKIIKHGESDLPNAWQSIAWRLERSHPESFSRPEIQLGVQVNQTTNNTLVITAEAAAKFAKRNAAINKELDEIGKAYEAKRSLENGSGGGLVREVESRSSLVPNSGAIALPTPAGRTHGWWKMLSSGSGERSITVEAADYALRAVVADSAGGARASGLKVEWDNEVPTLSELWNAISEACGEAGWAALVKRGADRPQDGPAGSLRRAQSSS